MVEKINGRPGEYEKDFMRTKFNSNDNLPLNKILKLHNLTVVVRSVCEEDILPSNFFAWMFVWIINERVW